MDALETDTHIVRDATVYLRPPNMPTRVDFFFSFHPHWFGLQASNCNLGLLSL